MHIIAGDKDTVLKTLEKGSYFGEIALFMHTKRISYVQAKTYCIVSMLKKTDIDVIILSFPNVAKVFREEALKRVNETRKFEELNKITEQQEDSRSQRSDDSFIQEMH